MAKTGALFFWLGGVLAPSIPDLIAHTLFKSPIEKVNIHARLRTRQLTTDLCLGHITAEAFCHTLIQEHANGLTIAELETAVKNAVQLRGDVLDVIAQLPSDLERWTICDYPKAWYEAAIGDRGLAEVFFSDHILFTVESRLSHLVPNIFDHLSSATGHPLDTCLLIDALTPRAVDAVKHGLDATIFVDARRLKRDFVLRRMLPFPLGFVHPGPAQQG